MAKIKNKAKVDKFKSFYDVDVNSAVNMLIDATKNKQISWTVLENINSITYSCKLPRGGSNIYVFVRKNINETTYKLNRGAIDIIHRILGEKLNNEIKNSNPEIKKSNSKLSNKKIDLRSHNNKVKQELEYKDFLIRSNVFKCMNKKHVFQNIDAVIKVAKRSTEEELEITIPAGYCCSCRKYYIHSSVYERVKKYGIIMNRVLDENTYRSTNVNGIFNLKDESILKQYGYCVSQEEGLCDIVRSKILANLVDHDILSKTEILSYLDFFIISHPTQLCAIDKWEYDKDFIINYKKGSYKKYGVGILKR